MDKLIKIVYTLHQVFFLGLEYDITELKSLVLKYIILMIFCFKFILSEGSETKT